MRCAGIALDLAKAWLVWCAPDSRQELGGAGGRFQFAMPFTMCARCAAQDSAGVTPAEASRIHQAWWVLQARLDSRSSRAGSRCQRVLTLFSGSSSARVRSVISSGFDPRWASWFRSKRFTALRRRWCDSRWKQVLSQTRAVCLSRTLRTHDLVPGD